MARFDEMRRLLVAQNRFYRDRLRLEFGEIPFTAKADLVEDQARNPPFGTNLTFPLESYVRMHQTSGTTGAPLVWLDTAESWDWWKRCWGRVYAGAGVTRGDRVFVAFSFGPFIGFWAAFDAVAQTGAMGLTGGGQSTEQRLRHMVDRQATILVCTPTYALRLAESASRLGMDLASSSIRATIHAGEPGAGIPSTRARIEAAFGARAFDHVGMTEVGAYGFQCEYRDGLHVNEDEFIAEVIDPASGAPAGSAGELVLTNLGRAGMPAIRYRTGDRVEATRVTCRCGLPGMRLIGGVQGRVDDMLVVRGVNIYPSVIEDIVRRHFPIAEFVIEVSSVRAMDELCVRVESGSADQTALHDDIAKCLGVRVSVIAAETGTLPRFETKSRRVVRK